jgi:uncharacterized protein YyaL (SSP411 family)
VATIRREGNHLVGQASPYLEQHAHNPVDWYPWGPEALDRARLERRLLFVSVGYATCHWCHVMERETFEDDETAALLNAQFVAIKIDREERPDLDALFIEAVTRLGQSAGWPLNLVLTPDLEPILGGTYYPRVATRGRPGLADVLREVDRSFRADPTGVAKQGKAIYAQISAEANARAPASDLDADVLRVAMLALARARDPVEGGFGSRQKFPNTPLLLAELRWVERTSAPEVRAHLVLTLDRMRRGGVRDQLSGSFHRYAVDEAWHVPHFEKTLYDNAQLAALYLEASRALADPSLEGVGREVLDDLIASWQGADGGLIVGFDADDALGEGRYYTFTTADFDEALGPADARLVGALFGVTPAGERSLGGRSVLHRRDEARVARELDLKSVAELDAAWARARPLLLRARATRPRPAADDKQIAAWNGLALMALADAGRTLGEPRYTAAAERIARFLVARCWDPETRAMRRGLRRGAPLGEGFLDDYALTGIGLLRLHAADGDLAWLRYAKAIADALVERFHDEELGVFVQTSLLPGPRAPRSVDDALPLRRPDVDDGVLPSGGSAAALLLVELGSIAGDGALRERGLRALRAAAPRARASPFAAGFFLVAIDHASADPREVVVAGEAADPRLRALVAELAGTSDARVLPVLLPGAGAPAELVRDFPALAGKNALHERPTAYVCRHGACDAPTDDPVALRRKLATTTTP